MEKFVEFPLCIRYTYL